LFRVDGVLTVAVHEPANPFLSEEISQFADGPVQLVAATASDINAILHSNRNHAAEFGIDDLLEDAGEAAENLEEPSFDLTTASADADGSPIIKLANFVIFSAVKEGASDIHIEPDEGQLRVRYRID